MGRVFPALSPPASPREGFMSISILDFAHGYLAKGLSVIPLKPKDKRPAIYLWKQFQERKPTEGEIHEWFGNGSLNNIGIVCGKVSGLAVVDLDTPEAVRFAMDHHFPGTPASKTGKGYHAFFRYRDGLRNFQKRDDLPGIDLRADGGYVVAPPSVHESGVVYSWLPGRSLADLPLAPFPEIILAQTPADKISLEELYEGVGKGRRNDSLARLCGWWARNALTLSECMEQAITWNQKNSPPLPERELEETVKSIFTIHHREKDQAKDSPKIEVGIHLTDLGNAQRFVNEHRTDLRYCYPWGKWLIWDSHRWKSDDSGEVHRRGKETVKRIYSEAAAIADEDYRKKLAHHALKSESDARIKAILSLAQSEHGIPILPEDMDRDPWLLNVANGTIDLKTGILRPHDPKDLITRIAPVEYRPDAECPFWLEHLGKIFQGNVGLISFLQLAFGYSLTGITDERCLFIAQGSGANGKTTTYEVFAQILGDFAVRTPTESVLIKREAGIPNDLAKLKGARFVYCSEVEEGKRLAESLIKDLTGNDTISARFLHGEFFTFQPGFKLWVATNHRPIIRGTDNAIWSRIRLIPFTVSIPECDRIPRSRMMERLTPELPGILAWGVQGCLEWLRYGMGTPQEVKAATEGYRNEMDVLGEFIEEVCAVSQNDRAKAKDLYEAFSKWAENHGEREISQKIFGMRLTERGFVKTRASSTGGYVWKGISLQPAPLNY